MYRIFYNIKNYFPFLEVISRQVCFEPGMQVGFSFAEEDWDSNTAFFKALGSKDKVIRASDNTPDDDIVRKLDQEISLYK